MQLKQKKRCQRKNYPNYKTTWREKFSQAFFDWKKLEKQKVKDL